jgi:hypothetical protein
MGVIDSEPVDVDFCGGFINLELGSIKQNTYITIAITDDCKLFHINTYDCVDVTRRLDQLTIPVDSLMFRVNNMCV